MNRREEMERLDRLADSGEGGLAVLHGRRRIGKTRLLLEWSRKHGGLYTVADQSAADVQRRYFAEAAGQRLRGFGDVDYRDWQSLLARLAREAANAGWRGPVIFDELPYLVLSSPEVPSALQRWVDHQAREARLVVAVAGSSQRMMQGIVLSGEAPLYGRAREIFEIGPIEPAYIQEVFNPGNWIELVEIFSAWGGVPRYWELAAERRGGVLSRIERLVLDPLGPLHREPDRLLIEEVPPAMEARPLLDAIGAGAHRVSEIAARLGRPATSMSRPLRRLIEMGLVRREVPFGESEKTSHRGLYKIDDPFFRLWFRVVAPHRGRLATSAPALRIKLLRRHWPNLAAQTWEALCRNQLSRLAPSSPLGRLGPWDSGSRWWKGALPEWDVVSQSLDGSLLLLGEAKWKSSPFDHQALVRVARQLALKPAPAIAGRYRNRKTVRALFVPELAKGASRNIDRSLVLVTASHLFPP